MNRTQLQQLAEERVRDAEALLNAGRWSGAYYLAGYAVECALKACIAKQTNQHDFPDKDLVLRSQTHKIEDLSRTAGIESQRQTEAAANPTFGTFWELAKDWNEKARYFIWTETEARDLFAAVTDTTHGVLPWIMVRW